MTRTRTYVPVYKTGYDKNEVFVFFKNNVVWHGYISGDSLKQKIIDVLRTYKQEQTRRSFDDILKILKL